MTGGAGFVGGNLAVELALRRPDCEIVALDNLARRGSELNLPRLRQAGVRFVHADVREADDLMGVEPIDALIECSAEPSALAGTDGAPGYLVRTNLLGAWHCLELARRDAAQLIFLSTSRVYPIDALNGAAYREAPTRFELLEEQDLAGLSAAGVAETLPLGGARTLYGATKLAAEVLIEEYASAFGLSTTINRCGVIAGPWQMGRVDQGVFAHWMLSHYFGVPLSYIGFGGSGKQVRDLLHVNDLIDLIDEQLTHPGHWAGATVNAGGGVTSSLSLLETTELCREITGRSVPITATAQTRPGDVRIYLSDCRRLGERSPWRPRHTPRDILVDLCDWIQENERQLATLVA